MRMALLTPEELPNWVPGELTVDSTSQNWSDVRLRGYRYQSLDVPVPAMRDYMLVVYREGLTPMNRKCSGPWRSETVGPGSVSLLTRSTDSHWHWTMPIDVHHLYISPARLAKIAGDACQREIAHVELRDILRADDPTIVNAVSTLVAEIQRGGLGGPLYVEALTIQICVHLLRVYASELRGIQPGKRDLTRNQARRIEEYLSEHLEERLTLSEIAQVAGTSVFHLIRQFHETFGCPPHAYVTRLRLERARFLIANEDAPLKCIAAMCGFYDQSHMTRLFRRRYRATPGEYRRNARSS